MRLYLDIETLPSQRPDVLEEIRASCKTELDAALENITPPSNYKDQAKIEGWWGDVGLPKIQLLKDAHERTVDENYRKTGLDGAFGHICIIGWALDDGEAQTLMHADDEKSLLRDFGKALKAIPPSELHSTMIVGHNCANFDIRFMAQRAIVHGIRPHPVIARAARAKPWEDTILFDTMVQWAGVGGRITLDKLCRALSVPSPKGEIDGSKVWDYVKAGRIAEVAEYCKRDVEATRAVHRRMTFAMEPIRQPEFDDVAPFFDNLPIRPREL
jgi:3'-5' exonuclease